MLTTDNPRSQQYSGRMVQYDMSLYNREEWNLSCFIKKNKNGNDDENK